MKVWYTKLDVKQDTFVRLRTDLKYPEDEDIYAETLKDYVSLEYGNNKYELDPKNSSWIDIKASDLVVKYNPFPDQGQGNSGTSTTAGTVTTTMTTTTSTTTTIPFDELARFYIEVRCKVKGK